MFMQKCPFTRQTAVKFCYFFPLLGNPPPCIVSYMMGLERGVYLYHKMTPPPNLGHSWVVFEGWSQILPSTKLFCHGFEQSCSAMATQKLKGMATRWGCRIKQNWLQEPIEGTWQSIPASVCTDLRHLCPPHLVHSNHLGGLVCSLWAK
jgi:hypothetical protein